MKTFYLSAMALALSCTLIAQSEEPILITGSWELTRVENIDLENRSFEAPNWAGTKLHFFPDGALAMENSGQFYLTTYTQNEQELSYEGGQFVIDRFSPAYWTFLFVDDNAKLNCRLHFLPLDETPNAVPEASSRVVMANFPLLMTTAQAQPQPEETPLYKVVEQMPRFPGCEHFSSNQEITTCAQQELLKFIYKNLSYPAEATENRTEGTVVITFVVEKNGSISNARIVREIGDGCGEEALRVVNLMTAQGLAWIPGEQRGAPVRVQFNLPVKFKLE